VVIFERSQPELIQIMKIKTLKRKLRALRKKQLDKNNKHRQRILEIEDKHKRQLRAMYVVEIELINAINEASNVWDPEQEPLGGY
jgi:hypothetical protein